MAHPQRTKGLVTSQRASVSCGREAVEPQKTHGFPSAASAQVRPQGNDSITSPQRSPGQLRRPVISSARASWLVCRPGNRTGQHERTAAGPPRRRLRVRIAPKTLPPPALDDAGCLVRRKGAARPFGMGLRPTLAPAGDSRKRRLLGRHHAWPPHQSHRPLVGGGVDGGVGAPALAACLRRTFATVLSSGTSAPAHVIDSPMQVTCHHRPCHGGRGFHRSDDEIGTAAGPHAS
jgi:hypothetical protein